MSDFSEHAFNSAWLGAPFAVAFGPEPLRLSADDLAAATSGFRWAEVRCDVNKIPTDALLPANGLVHVDTQLAYSLSTQGLPGRPERIRAVPYSDIGAPKSGFAFMPFLAERYNRLSAVDPARLDERYQLWALELVDSFPSLCFQLTGPGGVVGYAFGRSLSDSQVRLELLSGTPQSDVPGLGLYVEALHAYADLGFNRVSASFSSHNLAAMNAHIALGCRITSATEIWLIENY